MFTFVQSKKKKILSFIFKKKKWNWAIYGKHLKKMKRNHLKKIYTKTIKYNETDLNENTILNKMKIFLKYFYLQFSSEKKCLSVKNISFIFYPLQGNFFSLYIFLFIFCLSLSKKTLREPFATVFFFLFSTFSCYRLILFKLPSTFFSYS